METIIARVDPERALRALNVIATAGLFIGLTILALHGFGLVPAGSMAQLGILTIGSMLSMVASEELEDVVRPGNTIAPWDDVEEDA